jgi:hypothetical protein
MGSWQSSSCDKNKKKKVVVGLGAVSPIGPVAPAAAPSQPVPPHPPLVQAILEPAGKPHPHAGEALPMVLSASAQQLATAPMVEADNSIHAVAQGTLFDPRRATAMTPIHQPKFLPSSGNPMAVNMLAEVPFQAGPLSAASQVDSAYDLHTFSQAFGGQMLAADWH